MGHWHIIWRRGVHYLGRVEWSRLPGAQGSAAIGYRRVGGGGGGGGVESQLVGGEAEKVEEGSAEGGVVAREELDEGRVQAHHLRGMGHRQGSDGRCDSWPCNCLPTGGGRRGSPFLSFFGGQSLL